MKLKQQFAVVLKKHRKARGFTQDAFAFIHGLDRSYYSRVERGDANLTFDMAERITDALGIPILKLFAEIKTPTKRKRK
ncbi:MAG: helix-turn-helix domain-containing protein [Steroidobacteraceae bacterium]